MIIRRRLTRAFCKKPETEKGVYNPEGSLSPILSKLLATEGAYLQPRSIRGKLKLALGQLTQKVFSKSVPSFDCYREEDVQNLTFFNSYVDIEPVTMWTPLIQFIEPSEVLIEKLELLHFENEETKQKNFRTISHQLEFFSTQTYNIVRECISEAIEDTGYDFVEDFECLPDRNSKLHGTIPFLIYDKKSENMNYGFPLVFVLHSPLVQDLYHKTIAYKETHLGVAGVAQWGLNRLGNIMKFDKEFAKRVKNNEQLQSIKVLLTNGHNWRMYEFDLDYESRATHIYRPRSAAEVLQETGEKSIFKFSGDNLEKKIWSDLRHMQIVLGLIRYSLNKPTEKEKELQSMYNYLKELQGSDIMTPEEKAVVEKRMERSKYLPKFLKNLYVGSTFYVEEMENAKEKRKLEEKDQIISYESKNPPEQK